MTVVTIAKETFEFHYKGEAETYDCVWEIRTISGKNAVELVKGNNWTILVNLDNYIVQIV